MSIEEATKRALDVAVSTLESIHSNRDSPYYWRTDAALDRINELLTEAREEKEK